VTPARRFRNDGMVDLLHASVVTGDVVADGERATVEEMTLHPVGEELAKLGVGAATRIDMSRAIRRGHFGVKLAGVRRVMFDKGVDGDVLVPGQKLESGAVCGALAEGHPVVPRPIVGAGVYVENHVVYQIGEVEQDRVTEVTRTVRIVAHQTLIIRVVREAAANRQVLVPRIESAGRQ